MKVQVEELSPIEKKLSIEVESGVVSQELDRAYAELGRHVKLAGFRAGKVPRRILEQRFKDKVEDDVIQKVVTKAYGDAIRDQKVDAVSNPQVTNRGLRPNEPFAFEARVEVRPRFEPKDYLGIPIKRATPKLDETLVTDQLERLRLRTARLEPIPDRDQARPGDWALIDFEATIRGQPFPGGQGENVTIEVSAGELPQGHLPQLEGAVVGKTKEFDYTFPKDHPTDVRGKTAHFKVALKGLKTQVVPQLNDDFAKEVGGGQTLEELRAKIRADLERQSKAKAQQEERDALIDGLAERNPFEVPKAMVEQALDTILRGAIRFAAEAGIDVTRMSADLMRMREDMRPKAMREVKGQLLFSAIGEKEKIEVSDEEVDKKLEQISQDQKVPLSTLRKQFRKPDERRRLQAQVREEKTVEFLKAKATYS
jgi:trigger factor